MRTKLSIASLAIVTILAVSSTFGASHRSSRGVRTYVGETRPLGSGKVRSWVTTDRAGTPLAIGVSFTVAALSNLPNTQTAYPLALPAQAAATNFNHVEVAWNPNGHIPQGIYTVPHFDFHFFMISPDERRLITAVGENLAVVDKAPLPVYIPTGYVAAPGAEWPLEGEHWIDPKSPEFHGIPFTTTFIYGFYDGRMDFFEPMITRSYLLSKPNFVKPIAIAQEHPRRAYYPTNYGVHYDKRTRVYTVALGGMKMQK